MYNDDEDYLLEIEKAKRDKVKIIANDLFIHLTNSFTGKINASREIVEMYIQTFYKDVDKSEMSELVLNYITNSINVEN